VGRSETGGGGTSTEEGGWKGRPLLMRQSRVLALLCAGALLVAAGSDQDAREEVLSPLFWAEQARWLRNGGNFQSSERCERAQRRLSVDPGRPAVGGANVRGGGNETVTVAVLWEVGGHAGLLDVVGGLLARYAQEPGASSCAPRTERIRCRHSSQPRLQMRSCLHAFNYTVTHE